MKPMKLVKISIFCLIVFLTACAPKKSLMQPMPEDALLIQKADQAWEDKNFLLSQKLYAKIVTEANLDQKTRITAWERLALSAMHNNDYHQALTALKHWAELMPQIKNSWHWHKLYSQALKQTQSDSVYEEYLSRLIINNNYPFSLRLEAGYVLAKHYFAQKNWGQALQVYKELHEQAKDNESKIALETHLANFLEQLAPAELQTIKLTLDPAQKWDFPQNIVFWVYSIQKLKADNSCWPRIWPNLNSLIQNGKFTDVEPFLAEFNFWEKKLGKPSQTIGLTLPLSGPYATIGWKILRGASLAQWALLQDGVQIKIKTINTDAPDWQNILHNESEALIFGGPLLKKNWEELTKLGENERKLFFTFLPTIEQEGQAGWRFFPSPRDQVRVLIKKVILDLNFTNLAILYPEENYGRKMAKIFWEESSKLGAKITGLKSYPPDQPTRWGKIVASFLNIKDKNDPLQNPDPDFQAVFIPDSLSRVRAIIPQFFFYDENRLLFLGPMLWTQGFNPKELEVHYFSLALVPGAWWPENHGAKVTQLKNLLNQTVQGEPDFWVALGFDFVRFSTMLGRLSDSWHSSKINQILAQIQDMDWTMAPISWNEHGQASQDLFVFQPSSSGLIPANITSIEAKIEFRTERRAQRLEKLRLEQNSTVQTLDSEQLVQ